MAKKHKSGWEKGTETCPRCKKTTQVLITIRDGEEYRDGERCTACGWVIIFADDVEE